MNRSFNFTRALSVIALVAAVCLAPAFAQGPSSYPPTWVFARAYNGWSVIGQQASTYTFNGGVCYYSPYNNGQTAPIFDFAGYQGSTLVYNPVFVQDANSALNEIVTPTSVTNGTSSCGFNGTFANAHTSFTLSSGTAGLQEAITNQLQVAPVFDVILDKDWYQLVAGLTAGTTSLTSAQSIISSVTGTANVGIVDTTTSPWTFYSWNGSKYVPASSTGGVPATSLTVVAAPSSLNVTGPNGLITTSTTGGTIAASTTTYFIATYVTPLGGESLASTESSSSLETGASTATNSYNVTSPAASTGAVAWRLYDGSTGAEVLQTVTCSPANPAVVQIVLANACPIGSSATVTALSTGTALAPTVSGSFPPASGSSSPAQNIVSYPPFAVVGASLAAGTSVNLGVVNFPAGFLNSLGRTLRICGNGFASSTTTGDTLTLAETLTPPTVASVVTPWTVTTAADTASKTVPLDFCTTWVTSVVGTSGKIEAHGVLVAGIAGATGTAVGAPYQDNISAASSAIDLTKQDQLEIVLTTGASHGLSSGGAQLRQLTVEVLQ
jgi:hypothetical protein